LKVPPLVWGGLRDGYRRSQLGTPTGTVGQAPSFRGVALTPGEAVKAPKILASAARQNAGTNVCVPYPRVCPADELRDKGRLGPGDVAFVHRASIGSGSKIQRNVKAAAGGYGTPDANVHSLAGVDWLNRMLGSEHYVGGKSILVNSNNPADHWRSLSLLSEWSLDGIVISNDEPGYVLSSGTGERNDQLFNIAVQGPTQVNNGYADDAGRGVNGSVVAQLIKGPLYDRYPEQMFDRKVQPMSTLYVGLVCRYIAADRNEFKTILGVNHLLDKQRELNDGELPAKDKAYQLEVLEGQIRDRKLMAKQRLVGSTGFDANDGIKGIQHIHVFGYVLFTDRQAWQLLHQGNSNQSDSDGRRGIKRRMHAGSTDADQSYLPRDPNSDGFEGIKESELQGMVGAWKVGRVLDIASKRNERSANGMSGTAYGLTANVNIEFLDWRALRRTLGCGQIGEFHTAPWKWNEETGTFSADEGRLLQWPTTYKVYEYQQSDDWRIKNDMDIPINPYPTGKSASKCRIPINPYNKEDNKNIEEQRNVYIYNNVAANVPSTGFGGHRQMNDERTSLFDLQTKTVDPDVMYNARAYPQVEARADGSSAMNTTPVVPMLPAAAAKKPPKAPMPAPVAAPAAAPAVASKKAKLDAALTQTTPVGAPATATKTPVAASAAAPAAVSEQNEQLSVASLEADHAAALDGPGIGEAASGASEASESMLGMLVGDALGSMFGGGATPSAAASKKRSVPRRAARDR